MTPILCFAKRLQTNKVDAVIGIGVAKEGGHKTMPPPRQTGKARGQTTVCHPSPSLRATHDFLPKIYNKSISEIYSL